MEERGGKLKGGIGRQFRSYDKRSKQGWDKRDAKRDVIRGANKDVIRGAKRRRGVILQPTEDNNNNNDKWIDEMNLWGSVTWLQQVDRARPQVPPYH